MKWAKVVTKSSTYDVTHKKPALPKQKIFFRGQTRRFAVSFETFTELVEHIGLKKFPRKATCVQAFFFENLRILAYVKVLTLEIERCFLRCCQSIISAKFCRSTAYRQYLLMKAATLLFCMECLQTQVATSSLIN